MAGTYKYRIESRDVDSTLCARVSAMGDYVLTAAGDDADTLGFGVGDLNVSGASWVLSRVAVELRRLPREHENIAIYTWVSDYGRLMTTRNMTLTDTAGLEIGAAVTQWAMIDLATRRPLDLSALANKSTSLVDREPPIERPRKIAAIADDVAGIERTERKVVYSDIDFNGHVNSMKYVEWMVDALPVGPVGGGSPVSAPFRLDINYIHEALLGQELTILCATAEGETAGSEDQSDCHGRFHFDIRNSSGASICRAEIINH